MALLGIQTEELWRKYFSLQFQLFEWIIICAITDFVVLFKNRQTSHKSVFDLSCPYKNKLNLSSYYRLVKGLDKFRFNNIRVRRLNSNYGSMWWEIIMFSIQILLLTESTYLPTENNSIWIWFVLFVNYWKTRLFDFKHYCRTLIEWNAHTVWVAYSKRVYPHTKNQTLFVFQSHFHHIIPELIIFLHVHVLGKRQCMMKFYEL